MKRSRNVWRENHDFFRSAYPGGSADFYHRSYISNARSGKALAQFELPADSDKESFLDQKTGKRYDREAYQSYLTKTVQRMTDPQLQNLSRSRGDGSVWHELLMEAVDAERNRRRAAAEAACAEDEEAMEELCGEIAPFFWVEQAQGASVGLRTDTELQSVCTRQGLQGTGFDWDQLAKRYVEEQAPALKGKLEFDSQEDLFSAYARDEAALRTFIRGFREACEDAGQRTDRVVAER